MSDPKLTPYQKKQLSLANRFPAGTIQEYLDDPESFSLPALSLKNESGVACQTHSASASASVVGAAVPGSGDGFTQVLHNLFSELPQDQQRSYLFAQLREQGFLLRNEEPSNSFWSWVKQLNSTVADVLGLDDEVKSERTRFERCFSPSQSGEIRHFEDGSKAAKKFSCGRTGQCFWCRTKARKGTAKQYLNLAEECYNIYGMEKVWSLVFTLPEELEDKVSNKKDRLEIRRQIVQLIKSAFGVRTRDNLGIIIAEHPVGDSDIFRTRYHWHILVYPLYIRDNKVYYADKKQLNNEYIKDGWNLILGEYFDWECDKATYPQLKSYNVGSYKKYGWPGLAHRIIYDLRSFAYDLENKVIFNMDNGCVVVVKASNKSEHFWYICTIDSLAAQWLFICANNSIFTYGFIHMLSKWQDKGFFSQLEQEEKPEPVEKEPCQIILVRQKVFDKKKRRFVWQRYEIARVWKDKKSYVDYLIGRDIPWA